uniref:Uncharacterized protein n=2 Tax=Nonomuraea gerenzanensis TaxID=93944 RepID=A0A1M4DVI5_9ACTN|nr:hypothetical protein BN4615_P86 [Nonomuraea gerenzanensis]
MAAEVFSRVDDEWMTKHHYSGFPQSGPALISSMRDMAYEAGWTEDTIEIDGKGNAVAGALLPGYPILYVKEEWAEVMMTCRGDKGLGEAIRLGWQSSRLVNNTKKDGVISVNKPHMAVIGHVTPEEFKSCLSPAELAGGTFNRFMLLYVERARSLSRGGGLEDDDFTEMAKRLGDAVAFASKAGRVEFNEDCWEYWDSNIYEVLPNLSKDSEVMRGFCARSLGYVKRMAALYALSDKRTIIRLKDLKAAEAMFRYCIASVQFVMMSETQTSTHGNVTRMVEVGINANPAHGDPEVMARIVQAVKDAGEEGAVTQELYAALPKSDKTGKYKKAQLEAATALAMEKGLVQRFKLPSTGGRPAFMLLYSGPDEWTPDSDTPEKAAAEKRQTATVSAASTPARVERKSSAAPVPAEPSAQPRVSVRPIRTSAKPTTTKKVNGHDPLLDLFS